MASLPTGEQSLLLLQLPFAYQKCLDLGDSKGSAILGLHGSEKRVPARPASPVLNSYPYLDLVTTPDWKHPKGSLVKGSDCRQLLTRNRILVPPPPPGFVLQQAWVTLSLALFLPPSWFRVPRTVSAVFVTTFYP